MSSAANHNLCETAAGELISEPRVRYGPGCMQSHLQQRQVLGGREAPRPVRSHLHQAVRTVSEQREVRARSLERARRLSIGRPPSDMCVLSFGIRTGSSTCRCKCWNQSGGLVDAQHGAVCSGSGQQNGHLWSEVAAGGTGNHESLMSVNTGCNPDVPSAQAAAT